VTPTAEQSSIIDAARNSRDNLLVSAYAGAAKTTTLVMVCNALEGTPILSLAFNKKIAEEMKLRLPGHVQSSTMNALGHRVWAATIGKRLNVQSGKTRDLLKAYMDSLSRGERADISELYNDIIGGLRLARANGYIPEGKFPTGTSLISREAFSELFEDIPSPSLLNLIDQLLTTSIKQGFEGLIDFDDQVYLSTLFGGNFPRFPLVCIDEAQDLSPINHAMLRRLVTNRLIAVGDANQSIYGFRGAVHGGMESLRTTFNMRTMPLSTSFRCPRAVVRRANARVPDMTFPEWAVEGAVYELEVWRASDVPDGSAIICRNNAPLFRTALNLIRDGRGVRLVGSDIGPSLIRLLKKLGPETQTKEVTYAAIERWTAEQLRRSRSPGSVHDRAECLRVFADQAGTLSGAIAYASHLFDSSGPIELLSGHKSKGLEYDTVFHLDPWRIPSKYATTPEEIEQERNIAYVIETRAKRELYLISADGYARSSAY
jgi:DNA helicase-2/ATP-dependent DNA helicase PcrA